MSSPARSRPAGSRVLLYGITSGISANTLLRGQLAWFASQGWRVVLVSSDDPDAERAADREQVELRALPMAREISIAADLRALLRWIGLLRTIRPDAINASTPKAGLLGLVAGWLTRVPRRIYVVRGLRLEGSRGLIGGLLWLMERISMALATDVVFVSASLADEAHRRRLISPGKAWLIGDGSSNGVDAAAIQRRIDEVDVPPLRSRLGIPPSAFVIGFVGRVVADKGIELLIEAFANPDLDPRAHLLIIGAVDDDPLATSLAALGDRVHHVPWTDDVWGHLPAIDVLCLPTKREGFPNVVLEAASAGIPAIVTDATGSIDSVIDGSTGFVIGVGDSQAMVEHANRLARDPELTGRLGEAAQQRARQEFAPERIWQGLRSILDGKGATDDVQHV